MDLRVLGDRLSVCRLPIDAPWPMPPSDHSFFSVTRTADEISLICTEDQAPPAARIEPDWRAIEVAGPLDFAMVGVLADLTRPLADISVSVFVISTYDTDYVMVHAGALERAVEALRAAGHHIEAA